MPIHEENAGTLKWSLIEESPLEKIAVRRGHKPHKPIDVNPAINAANDIEVGMTLPTDTSGARCKYIEGEVSFFLIG